MRHEKETKVKLVKESLAKLVRFVNKDGEVVKEVRMNRRQRRKAGILNEKKKSE